MQGIKKETKRFESVDMLRGIAALSVCLFHLSSGSTSFLGDGFLLKRILSYGHLGVEMFFIISGFVIPYSMYRINHQYKDTKSFIIRRVLRVDPPYLIMIFIIILLNFISTYSPYYKGIPYHIDFYNLALHFGYLNSLLGQPWLSPVFWTLAIEFQFYISMALLFPFLVHKNKIISALTCLIFFTTFFIFKNRGLIFYSSPFFTLGIWIFYLKVNYFSKKILWPVVFFLLVFIYLNNSIAVVCVCTFTFAVISFLKHWSNKYLLFLGTISYSMYLVHESVGGGLIHLSINFFYGNYMRTLALIGMVLITILISYCFYKIVEYPAIRLSKKTINKWRSIDKRGSIDKMRTKSLDNAQ